VTFLLAHLSDAHIGPLPRPLKRDLMGKRLTGWLNWRHSRCELHDMGVLARIVEDIKAHKPDHVAMTGDILNIGLPSEFPLASAWLDTLGPRSDVSFVPGNHDAYVRSSLPYLARTFAPWTGDRGQGVAHFPYLRLRDGMALIGLSSGVPTPPLVASGRLGLQQRQALARLLDETRARGLVRVIMIHHPPYRRGATPGRGLSDAAEFEDLLKGHGAELVIHGHNHRRMLTTLPSLGGSTPVAGVASASAVPGSFGHRAAWNLYSIKTAGGGPAIDMRVRGLLPDSDEIGDLHHETIA
jgi:3',5'-cyclic AMP phosphodiesterase CpdA